MLELLLGFIALDESKTLKWEVKYSSAGIWVLFGLMMEEHWCYKKLWKKDYYSHRMFTPTN